MNQAFFSLRHVQQGLRLAALVSLVLVGLAKFTAGTLTSARQTITQPTQVAQTSQVTFGVIGDNGTGSPQQYAVGKQMALTHQQLPYDMVLMLGDNFYGAADFVKKFEKPYEQLLARNVRFFASIGNHDLSSAEKQIAYDKFNMGGKRYYSFERGDKLVQFFALDSNAMNEKQLSWLDAELAASQARWKVAFFHHPLYSAGKRHGSDDDLRDMLEPLFVKHGVNLVLSGHDHFYERVKPQKGIHYFVSGSAGQLRKGNLDKKDDTMAFGNDQVHHFMVFEVATDSIRFQAISDKGSVLDSGVIPFAQTENKAKAATTNP